MADKSIRWKWVLISIVIMLITQVILNAVFMIFSIVTLGIGAVLFLIIKPVIYFVGGFITGRVSPGKTILEPAIGAIIMTVAGAIFDSLRLFSGRTLIVIIASVIGFIAATAGASIGERMQGHSS